MTNKKCEGIDCAWCMSIECLNEKKTEMTDKENNFAKDINVPSKVQINDSLKNSDKNFNENYTHNKKQITIDTNKYFLEVIDEGGGTVGYTVVQPEKLLREIMKQNKQLTSKIQELEKYKKLAADFKDVNKQLGYKYLTIKDECEKLKRKNELMMDCLDCKVDEYKTALEEIESIADDYNRTGKTSQYYRDGFEEILDIINKVKGEKKCQ